jgi:ABC-type sugar transport system ATPase subunit
MRLGGEGIRLPVDHAVARQKPGPVTVGIRPRAFSVAGAAGAGTISVQAELIEPMGAETLIHARMASGGEIRVVLPREMRVAIGTALHLMPEAGQCHVFGADGKAVRT